MSDVRVLIPAALADRITYGARRAGLSEGEFLAAAVEAALSPDVRPPGDPWEPVRVYGRYRGVMVTGQFIPATGRLRVTSEPFPGRVFNSPTGASRAVVVALNPARRLDSGGGVSGWQFWRVAHNGARLTQYRR